MFLDPVVNLLQNIVNKTTGMEATSQLNDWDSLVDACDNESIVFGYVDHKVERGYMIRFGEILGFAPRYRFDLCDYDTIPNVFIGEPLPFMVLSIDPDNAHLVVSRIDAVTQTHSDYLDSLSKNQIIQGIVSSVMDTLVTIDVGGITCLVPRTELSWKPFNHPSELFNVGDEVSVKLLKVVPAKAYMTASLKQLDNTCWQFFIDAHEVGDVVTVQVSNVTEFGYFVTYDNQLSGILHWSELSWKARNKQSVMTYNKGDQLQVKVSDLDFDKQRVSFSLKAMLPDPAEKVLSEYQVDDVVTGIIRSRTDFGLFIEIADNFNGLLHFSNLSWFTNSKNNLVNFRAGMQICCKIIDIDKDNERVGLGLKQLYKNPFETQPSLQSLTKSDEFPREVRIAVSSYFQANCHNQIVGLLTDLQQKMRQHVDLKIDNVFFDNQEIALPDILVVLISDDFFTSDANLVLREYLSSIEGPVPLVLPVVADTVSGEQKDPLLEFAFLPVDGKPLQQWRVKSAYWSTVNKALTRSVRYVAGLK